MSTFSPNVQIAILALTAILVIGSVVSAYDYFRPSDTENFQVQKKVVSVPDITSPVEAAAPTSINTNTAAAGELTQLPVIGPKTADQILAYRSANAPFSSVDELTGVKRIGSKTLDKLRPLITLSSP